MRTSAYKEKILTLLKKEHLLSIGAIHTAFAEVDYSTIFRNVEQLVMEGKLKKVVIGEKSVAYELLNEQHDHFVCDDCGKVESIHVAVSKKELHGARAREVTVHGTCTSCQ